MSAALPRCTRRHGQDMGEKVIYVITAHDRVLID